MTPALTPPPRATPPFEAGERATLTAFLDFQRATLALKCDGLTEEQLKRRSVPPSGLSLLGIVRHMAEVERNWFRPVLGGEPLATIFGPDMDWEASFRDVAAADVAEAFGRWQAECDHARALVAAAPSLDGRGFRLRGYVSLRWVLTHMIEEYARHNGHADLLRERLDGSTGE
ncbi:MAG TPA: DinB family protein [Streptosporangiaceae bacterium]|nr:DinB family protein [Streptosporangiaceae bacterium]